MEFLEGARILTDEKHLITGINAAFGNAERSEELWYGNIREYRYEDGKILPSPHPAEKDSIYDLASVTKVFTSVAVLQLYEKRKFRLDTPLSELDSRFPNIGDFTVYDLLAFQKAISSSERIDAQPDAASAEKMLFESHPSPRPERRFYTDMGSMVLKYVVESVSGLSYSDYLKENILNPLGMKRTFATVPEELYPETACYNLERRITADGEYLLDTKCPVGTVHDPKARLISPKGGNLCGHAGLFSTAGDMALFAQGLLHGAVLSPDLVRVMGINRTGHLLPDGTYSHHLGYLCYAKHPVQTFSEVPAFFSDRTIALNGFAGNHFSVDPVQNKFIVLLSNRIENRITVATGRPDPESRIESILWPDGKEYPVSQNYVYYKDEYLKNPIGKILEERF